eukprot:6214596-Pleurochrysis_carterae.AAC.1
MHAVQHQVTSTCCFAYPGTIRTRQCAINCAIGEATWEGGKTALTDNYTESVLSYMQNARGSVHCAILCAIWVTICEGCVLARERTLKKVKTVALQCMSCTAGALFIEYPRKNGVQ